MVKGKKIEQQFMSYEEFKLNDRHGQTCIIGCHFDQEAFFLHSVSIIKDGKPQIIRSVFVKEEKERNKELFQCHIQ